MAFAAPHVGLQPKKRTRTCTNPVPSSTGRMCDGDVEEVVDCNLNECGNLMEFQALPLQIPVSDGLILSSENSGDKNNAIDDNGDGNNNPKQPKRPWHGITKCPQLSPGDNASLDERFLQENDMIDSYSNSTNSCILSCETRYPDSIGITISKIQKYRNGMDKCWCELGSLNSNSLNYNQIYQTCVF